MRALPTSRILALSIALAACASPSASGPRRAGAAARGELAFAAVAHPDVGGQAWNELAGALKERLRQPSPGGDAPAPALVLVCGDSTRDGEGQDSWSAVEQRFDDLGPPWFAVAGRSDLGRRPALEGFEKRFGGLVYSFDRGGAHFVALCSPSPGGLRPWYSPLQLAWLREDLARNDDRKPVFVFVYHPPDSPDLAPSQVLDLRAALDGHDVAAVFCGQERAPACRRVGDLDCVQCGSVSPVAEDMDAPGAGYALATIAGGELRVAYCWLGGSREPLLLLAKTLRQRTRAPFSIEEPPAGAPARGGSLSILVRSPRAPSSCLLDGERQQPAWTKAGDAFRARLPLQGLDGGAHQLAVGCDDGGQARIATRAFLAPSEVVEMRWRRSFSGSLCAPPVRAGSRIAVASTAGEVAVLDAGSGELVWSAKTAAVLGAPLGCSDGGLVTADIEGWVKAFDPAGVPRWRYQVGKPVLGGLAGSGELVFVADLDGDVFALELATGARRAVAEASLPALPGGPEGAPANGRKARVDENGVVSLVDAASGAVLWSWRAGAAGSLSAAPLVGEDGTVWVAGRDGCLSAVHAR